MFRRTLIAAAFTSFGVTAVPSSVFAEEKSTPQFSALDKPASAVVRTVAFEHNTTTKRVLIPADPTPTKVAEAATVAPSPAPTSRLSSVHSSAATKIAPSRVVTAKLPAKTTLNFGKALSAATPETQEKPAVKVVEKVATVPVAKPATITAAPIKKKTPSRLASREAQARMLMLARLDADLARAERRLARAESSLSAGQRSLKSVVGVLELAISESGTDSRGLHPFVRVAQRYLGTPYVWGGESARGFDCSGFIMRVMRDLGYKALPHSAAEQFRYGTPISRGLLRPGDIVFFANTYKPGVSHVGIYLGRDRFIHAANSKDGTIVSSLNSPKWVEKYAGARRLVAH